MDNINRKTLIVILISVFIAGLSIASYFGIRSKAVGYKTIRDKQITTYPSGGPVRLKTSLNNQYFYDNQNVYLYVDLTSDKIESDKERTPMNLSVVIDRSGSMADKNKLSYVKRAVDYMIDQLDEKDYLSIVMYDDNVDVIQPSSRVRDKYELKDKVSRIQPGGFTNLSDGMFEGYDQAERKYSSGYVNRVLLLSDGLANRGITDRFKLADKVRDKNSRDGITISTFGVGNDFNEDLMAKIADYGKGNYYYIRNSEEIPEIFAQELRDVRYLIGQSTKVRIKYPGKYLKVNHVFGYPYDIDGDDIVIDFKDLFAGQGKSLLIKFDIKNKIDERLFFETELTYQDVNNNYNRITERSSNDINPVSNRTEYDKGYDEKVQQNVAVFESNYIMEEALKNADDGKYDEARIKVQESQQYLKTQMDAVTPSPQMLKQQDNLNKYNQALENAETKTEEEKQEMQKSGKYDNYNTEKSK